MLPADLSLAWCVAVGRDRSLPFAADGVRWPFVDAVLDAVTISFGPRTMVGPDAPCRTIHPRFLMTCCLDRPGNLGESRIVCLSGG